jgi:hypothetical protein
MLMNKHHPAADQCEAGDAREAERLVPQEMHKDGDQCIARGDPRERDGDGNLLEGHNVTEGSEGSPPRG